MITFSLCGTIVPALRAQTTDCGQAYDITVGTTSLSAISTSAWTSGKVIWVTGTLTVDQSITLDNLRFIMKQNSAIIVSGSGVVMTAVNNTRFDGCSAMWWGVTVQNSAAVLLNGTQIKQAFMGLKFVPGANTTSSELQNCYLEDNLFGLFASGFGAASPLRFSKFSGNTFAASINALLPPPTGVTYSGTEPWRGIWLLNTHADLSFGASAKNKVKGYRYGMFITNSNVTLTNCRFESNYGDGVATDPNDGTDIYADQSTLVVSGSSSTRCEFYNSATAGVLSNRTRALAVVGAKFQAAETYGIRCTNSDFAAAIVILGNEFILSDPNFISGIRVERPAGGVMGSVTSIYYNTFTVPLPTDTHFKKEKILIDVTGLKDATDIVDISGNSLDVASSVNKIHGIRISGKGNNYQLQNGNVLTWQPSATPSAVAASLGIIAKDLTGTNHVIRDNTVKSKLSGSNSYLQAGLQASNILGTMLICQNLTDNTHKGLECISGLKKTHLKRNEMGNGVYGLYCAAGTFMPNQYNYENTWPGSYTTLGAFYNGSPDFVFIYDDALLNSGPSFLPLDWFDENDGSDGDCTTIAPTITAREQEFIDGTASIDTSSGNWDARRELIYKLLRYPELVQNDEDAADYLDDEITNETSPVKFAHAEWLFDQAYVMTAGAQTKFNNFTPQYRLLVDSLLTLDDEQAADTTTYDLTIAQDRADVFDDLMIVVDSLNAARIPARARVDSLLLVALTYAQGLPQTKVYEVNLRHILSIGIRQAYAGDTVLTNTDYTTLTTIAAQCPALGGISVRRAPLHLLHEEDVTYVTKDWTTGCAAYQRADSPRQQPLTGIQVRPNPASQALTLTFPAGSAGRWQVANFVGNLVAHGNWTADAPQSLAVANWPAGMYTLLSRDAQGQAAATKFLIAH